MAKLDPADSSAFSLKMVGKHHLIVRAHNSKWSVDFTIPAISHDGLFEREKTVLVDPGIPPTSPKEELEEALDNEIRSWILNELQYFLKR